MCTFEKGESCLLTNDHAENKEMWNIVDGRGVVADNTLRNGLYIHAVCIPYHSSVV